MLTPASLFTGALRFRAAFVLTTVCLALACLTITSGASGTETGTVNFGIAPTTQPRTARPNIARRSFPVYQEFDSCGAPTFSVANYGLADNPTIAKAADLDGDGDTDLLMATDAISSADTPASVMINNGTGGFKISSFFTGFVQTRGFAFGDFNGDKRPDLAIWGFPAKVIGIRYNDGAGNFASSTASINFDTNVGGNQTSVMAADVNRDGKDDLLVSTPESGNLRVMLGDGAGNFTAAAPVVTQVGNDGFELLSVEDFNGDGKLDLLLASGITPQFSVRLGDGAGGFGPDLISSTAFTTLRVVTGDFDGDGRRDIVYVGTICPFDCPNPLIVMTGDGAGHFTQKSRADDSKISQLTAADFNRDGKLDVAYTLGGHSLALRAGDGLGGFASPVPFSTGPETQFLGVNGIVSADFNKDGRPDLAVADYTLGASVLTNNCAGAPFISGRITVGSGAALAGVTVTLSGAKSATTQTDDGGNFLFGGLAAGANYVVTPSKETYDFTPQSLPFNNLSGGQAVEFTGTVQTISLAQSHYLVDENLNTSLSVEVVRTGSALGAASVIYLTGDTDATAPASERSDYTRAVGTLHFAPGEAKKSFTVLLNDDALVEGVEGFAVDIVVPSGAVLGFNTTALVEIRDDDFAAGANPIDGSTFFVRQHYHDFLNREPDARGLNFWVNEIEKCQTDSACRDVRRINVSAAFFLSIEFQETGYLVYRAYKAAYGDATSPGVAGTVPIIRLEQFLPDTQQIGSGLEVGVDDWQAKLEANKVAYFQEFVTRARFTRAAPVSMTPAQFVDALFANAGVTPSASQRQDAINEFGNASNTSDNAARGRALRRVAENQALSQLEKNRAFVLMEYFGYLRRNPDDAPQLGLNYSGWKFWLGKLEEFNGNFIRAEMVKAFLSSDEYRKRFGQ